MPLIDDTELAEHLLMHIDSTAEHLLNVDDWRDSIGRGGTRRPRDWAVVAASPHLPDVIAALERTETAARQMRLFMESLRDGKPARTCASCDKEMYGRADRRYCSGACRQRAHRTPVAR